MPALPKIHAAEEGKIMTILHLGIIVIAMEDGRAALYTYGKGR